jgi:hypothetical protein
MLSAKRWQSNVLVRDVCLLKLVACVAMAASYIPSLRFCFVRSARSGHRRSLAVLCEIAVIVFLNNKFFENVVPGSSLRSASKLQEETSKRHIFVVIFNISLIFLKS